MLMTMLMVMTMGSFFFSAGTVGPPPSPSTVAVEAYRRAPREGPARQRQRRELSVVFRVA